MDLETHILTLPQGQIKGIKRQSVYEQAYYSFEGIPYAQPPVGELRFKAPLPAQSWQGVRDCTDFNIKPMQKNPFTGVTEGSEDCLYLNVYTKQLKSELPLPVMVWIYGGAFVMNSGTRDTHSPDYFMNENVLLVTFNYRLCSLGFLSLRDPKLNVPGNAALKDQVLALRWVKQHIAHFNGDANNITVFGVSAGGLSTHYMASTEQTRGLFHKAIPMAGSLLNDWAITPQTDFAYRLAKAHGYAGDNIDEEVLMYLRQLAPEKLVTHNLPTPEERRNGIQLTFGPTVEPYSCADCVIPQPPAEMLKTAWGNAIPMIFGGTSSEGMLYYPRLKMSPQSMDVVQHDPISLLPSIVRQTHSPEQNQKLSKQLIQLHFGDQQPGAQTLLRFIDYYSYYFLWTGVHRSIVSRLRNAHAPTYLYRFDFDSLDFNHSRNRFCGKDNIRGAAHADEVSYLFHSTVAWKLPANSAEYKTIQRMVGMWTAFAKHSDPNCEQIQNTVWRPLQADDPWKAINISENVKFMEIPEREKLEFWNSLYVPMQ